MKANKFIFDDPNGVFVVQLESGEEFRGAAALDQIMLRHRDPTKRDERGPVREKDMEPYIDIYGRRFLRKLKKEEAAKKKYR